MNNSVERITQATNTRFYGLDHLRALAISLVFVFHYNPHQEWTRVLNKFGWSGVDLFFVLSGFLIASPLFSKIAREKKIVVYDFYINRFFRIIPAYLIVVALYFCLPYIRERSVPSPLWKYLTFTQNLSLNVRANGAFSHAWSLCIEEQFYFLFPLIIATLVYTRTIKKGLLLLIAFFVFGFIARAYAYHNLYLPFNESDDNLIFWYKWIYYPTYSRLDGLLTGIAIAALFQFRLLFAKRISNYGNLLFVLSIVILTGAYFLFGDEPGFSSSVFGFPLVSIGYGLMVLAAISPSCFLYKFKSSFTTFIATLSYSVYLIHKFVIHITQEQFSRLGIFKESSLMFFISVITCLIGAYILNRLVEKPFLNLRNKILEKRRSK